MNVNRNHKDSVFTLLFSEPSRLLDLYNALADSDYGPDSKIEINTLENALFHGSINDISFLLDDKLIILIEHQSTVSENFPLRFLLYIARVLEKIIDDKAVYRHKLVKIPTPEFTT